MWWRRLTDHILLLPFQVCAEVVHHDDGTAGHGFFTEEAMARRAG